MQRQQTTAAKIATQGGVNAAVATDVAESAMKAAAQQDATRGQVQEMAKSASMNNAEAKKFAEAITTGAQSAKDLIARGITGAAASLAGALSAGKTASDLGKVEAHGGADTFIQAQRTAGLRDGATSMTQNIKSGNQLNAQRQVEAIIKTARPEDAQAQLDSLKNYGMATEDSTLNNIKATQGEQFLEGKAAASAAAMSKDDRIQVGKYSYNISSDVNSADTRVEATDASGLTTGRYVHDRTGVSIMHPLQKGLKTTTGVDSTDAYMANERLTSRNISDDNSDTANPTNLSSSDTNATAINQSPNNPSSPSSPNNPNNPSSPSLDTNATAINQSPNNPSSPSSPNNPSSPSLDTTGMKRTFDDLERVGSKKEWEELKQKLSTPKASNTTAGGASLKASNTTEDGASLDDSTTAGEVAGIGVELIKDGGAVVLANQATKHLRKKEVPMTKEDLSKKGYNPVDAEENTFQNDKGEVVEVNKDGKVVDADGKVMTKPNPKAKTGLIYEGGEKIGNKLADAGSAIKRSFSGNEPVEEPIDGGPDEKDPSPDQGAGDKTKQDTPPNPKDDPSVTQKSEQGKSYKDVLNDFEEMKNTPPEEFAKNDIKQRVADARSDLDYDLEQGNVDKKEYAQKSNALNKVNRNLESGKDVSVRDLDNAGIDTDDLVIKDTPTRSGKSFQSVDLEASVKYDKSQAIKELEIMWRE